MQRGKWDKVLMWGKCVWVCEREGYEDVCECKDVSVCVVYKSIDYIHTHIYKSDGAQWCKIYPTLCTFLPVAFVLSNENITNPQYLDVFSHSTARVCLEFCKEGILSMGVECEAIHVIESFCLSTCSVLTSSSTHSLQKFSQLQLFCPCQSAKTATNTSKSCVTKHRLQAVQQLRDSSYRYKWRKVGR